MSIAKFEDWFAKHNIDEIECLVPDLAGTPRGKILPTKKFLKGVGNTSMRLPEDIFLLTVTGKYSFQDSPVSEASGDVYLAPDYTSLKLVPWHENPTAQVICDCFYLNGDPVDISPRFVLQRVLELYAERAGNRSLHRNLSSISSRRTLMPIIRSKLRLGPADEPKRLVRPMVSTRQMTLIP